MTNAAASKTDQQLVAGAISTEELARAEIQL